jgi:hypothetical protein
MNSLSPAVEESDGRFFSERAKNIFLSSGSSPTVQIQPLPSDSHFSFSNRNYGQTSDMPLGHATPAQSVQSEPCPRLSAGRGRTAVPLSPFVLQRDTERTSTANSTISSPISSAMHDDGPFVPPYLEASHHSDGQILPSTSSVHRRNIFLSLLKEIESDLKRL